MSIELTLLHLKYIYLKLTQLNEQKESNAFIFSFSENGAICLSVMVVFAVWLKLDFPCNVDYIHC